MNRKGELCVTAKLDLRQRHRAGSSRRLRLPRPRRRERRSLPQPARDAQGAARRPRDRAAHRHRPARPARRARSSTCSRAPTSRSSAGSTRSAASRSSSPRTAASTRTCSCRTTSAATPRPATSSSSRSSSSRRRSARRSRASSRCSAATRTRAWRSRSRCASTICRTSSRSRRASRRRSCRADVSDRDRAGRVDLTALPLVTIDGETAKDFDDAVYCASAGRGFRLIVAIADVSHYVKDGDPLDRDARERGTSVYFPRRVIPMLPEALSNELCSLKPRGRPPVHGLRHGDHRRRGDRELQVLSGRDALAGAAHLHAGVELAVGARSARRARRRRCCRSSTISTRCSRR